MIKNIFFISGLVLFSAMLIWLFPSGLWLERFLNYFQTPVYGKTWKNEVEKFEKLYTLDSAEFFFLGDSHIEQCEWQELFPEFRCANRGIGGETTSGLLSRISFMPAGGRNRRVILQTGINDLISGAEIKQITENYTAILDTLKGRKYRPLVTLVFPVRYMKNVNESVWALNSEIFRICRQKNCQVIQINREITRRKLLAEEFTGDGIHLNFQGYQIWSGVIRKAIFSEPDSCSR